MMKERNDPEKQNLLDPREQRRPKQYTTTRTKQEVEYDTSTSVSGRKRTTNKETVKALTSLCSHSASHTTDDDDEDACSCMTCAAVHTVPKKRKHGSKGKGKDTTPRAEQPDGKSKVGQIYKRVLGSELTCIAFLSAVFLVSVTAAVLIVFKTIPTAASQSITKEYDVLSGDPRPFSDGCHVDSERLKRKIEMIGDNLKQELNQDGVFGKIPYDKMESNMLDGYKSPLLNLGPRLQDLRNFDNAGNPGESSMQMDDKNKDKLKKFYNKLIETDAKINKLKRLLTVEDNIYNNIDDDKTPDRTKRSLKLYNYPKKYKILGRKRKLYLRKKLQPLLEKDANRAKRSINDTRSPTGFVIEKKKLVVEYEPVDGRKVVPKCSHAPVDSQSRHEHQRKHPFYQNTQRLDELLDKFLNRNLPEIIEDPFHLDYLFKHTKNKCKHSSTAVSPKAETFMTENLNKKDSKQTTRNELYLLKADAPDTTYNVNKYFESPLNQIPKPKMKSQFYKFIESTTKEARAVTNKVRKGSDPSSTEAGMLLSVSTVMSPIAHGRNADIKRNVTNMRHLLQMEGEDEENVGYEDFKEVLTDDLDDQDDVERRAERKRRVPGVENETPEAAADKSQKMSIKYGVPGILNPNWKGPMPLYPDELSTMIKQQSPLGNHHKGPEIQNREMNKRSLNDVEYVEDYFSNKDSNLVEMAQAYSDYGVLEGKKGSVAVDKKQVTDNIVPSSTRVQLSADWHLLPRGLLTLKNKDKEQYGITKGINRISAFTNDLVNVKIQPTTAAREDIALTNLINSHIKLESPGTATKKTSTTSLYPFFANETRFKKANRRRMNYGFHNLRFPIKKRRHLLSTLFNSPEYENDGIDDDYDSFDKDDKKIKKNNRNVLPPISKKSLGSDKLKEIKQLQDRKVQMSNPRNFDDSIPVYNAKFGNTESDIKYRTHMSTNNVDVFRYPYMYETLPLPIKSSTETGQPNENADHYLDRSKNMMSMYYDSNSTSNPLKNFTDNQVFYSRPVTNTLEKHNPDLTETNDLENVTGNKYTTQNVNTRQQQNDFKDAKELTEHLYEISMGKLKAPDAVETSTTSINMESDNNVETIELDKLDDKLQSLSHSVNSSTTEDQSRIISAEEEREKDYDIDMPSITTGNPSSSYNLSYIATSSLNSKPMLSKSNLVYPNKRNIFKRKAAKATETTSTTVLAETQDIHATKDEYEGQTEMKEGIGARYVDFNAALVEDMNKYEPEKQSKENTEIYKVDNTKDKNPNDFGNDVDYLNYENEISNKMLSIEKRSLKNSEKLTNNDEEFNETRNNMVNDYLALITDWFQNRDKRTPNKPFYRSGHKSRVLMSLKEDNVTEESVNDKAVTETKITDVVERNKTAGNDLIVHSNVTEISLKDKENDIPSTTETVKTSTKLAKETTTHEAVNTDTVKKVKRNADESNLVFWNDIYDDEYGIYTNNVGRTVRSGLYPKEADFLKRSGRWVQDKIKKFADNIRGKEHELPFKKRIRRSNRNFKIGDNPMFRRSIYDSNIYKRSTGYQKPNNVYQMSIFNNLGAKMVDVCKKAAQSVRQASEATPDEKEEHAQSSMTTSLMQQLVHLLTDLIDYQIQASTCTKLPPDLKSFLHWLVLSENDPAVAATEAPVYSTTLPYSDEGNVQEVEFHTEIPDTTFYDNMPVEIKFDTSNQYPRNQYADTVKSVNELVDEYEDIRNPNKYNNQRNVKPYHRKRQFNNNLRFKQPKYRYKRRANKFVKTFEKKHTRTTAASYYYESILSTDSMSKSPDSMPRLQSPSKSFKRNLKDVYYKAVAEAKKIAACGKGNNRNIISYTTGPSTKNNYA